MFELINFVFSSDKHYTRIQRNNINMELLQFKQIEEFGKYFAPRVVKLILFYNSREKLKPRL